MKDWNGIHVVITGASSGIGEKLTYGIAKRGGTPIMLARSYDKLMEIKSKIQEETKISPFVFALDVTDEQSVIEAFAKIEKEVGHIDVLINNAGFGVFESAHEASLETIKSMFAVNVFGAISCTQAVVQQMRARGTGHIIFIASQAGKLATPKSGGYAATKHAILGFANSLRMELVGTGVHVSAVNPGPVRTPFFDTADESGNYRKNVERFMLDATVVAEKTINLIEKPKRELNLPGWMGAGAKLYQLFPAFVEKIAGNQFHKK